MCLYCAGSMMTPPSSAARGEEKRLGRVHWAPIAAIWTRSPAVVRAFLAGVVVKAAGSDPCFLVLFLNLRLIPILPWSVPLIGAYLWIFWRYLDGWGWPRSTSETRRRLLRARPLSPPVWGWSLLAGGTTATAFCAVEFLAQRFVPSDPPRLPDLSQASPLMFVATYLTASVVAGVVEEAAFRGYMQSLIERRHGAFVAVSIVALVFTVYHLGVYPSMSLPQFLGLLGISLTYGILAQLTGSILPGLVIHTAGNAVAFLFSWWYARSTGSLRVPLFRETGADAFFWANAVAAVLFSAAALWTGRRLALLLCRGREAGTAGPRIESGE